MAERVGLAELIADLDAEADFDLLESLEESEPEGPVEVVEGDRVFEAGSGHERVLARAPRPVVPCLPLLAEHVRVRLQAVLPDAAEGLRRGGPVAVGHSAAGDEVELPVVGEVRLGVVHVTALVAKKTGPCPVSDAQAGDG